MGKNVESEEGTKAAGNAKRYLLLLAIGVFLLAYAVPVAVYFRPFGMDMYSHMIYTRDMAASSSLSEFYDKIKFEAEDSELGHGYPFGLWYFGAIMAKVTGLGVFDTAIILPLFLIFILCVLTYMISRLLTASDVSPSLSVAFMLSIPVVSISLLSYRTDVFVSVFLLTILYLNHKHEIRLRKVIPLTAISVFALCLAHTGTYIFLLTFTLFYVLLKSSIWGMFQRRMFSLIAILLVVYVLTMNAFPQISAQYVDKASEFAILSEMISGKTHIAFPGEIGNVFYQEVFVNRSLIYAIMWSALIFALCRLIIHIREICLEKLKDVRQKNMATIPILGGLKNVSHSVLTTPLWIGPLHMLLTFPGYFRLNVKGKCMLLTATIVTVIPGMFETGATGALREIFYLIVILPFSAAAGFSYIFDELLVEGRLIGRIGAAANKALTGLFLLCIFSAVIITPLIGNIYYLPSISGTYFEVNGLKWLNTVNDPDGKSIGYGYRYMVDVYANKTNPWTRPGTETRTFIQDLLNGFFSANGTDYVRELYYTFRGNYLISSDRVINNLKSMEDLIRTGGGALEYENSDKVYLDSNTYLDKIYSNGGDFQIYRYIPPTYDISRQEDIPEIRFDENDTTVKDAGISFLIKTDAYAIQLDKKRPEIIQFLTKDIDAIGEGYMNDQVVISFMGGPYNGYSENLQLNELDYPVILLRDNAVSYKTVIKDDDGANLATLTVGYTFYQKAIKKEITVANDWVTSDEASQMQTMVFNSHYSTEFPYFTYFGLDGSAVNKTVYPSDETIKLQDLSFDRIYFNNGFTGIYYLYDDTSTYPDEIRYKRSTVYNYSYSSVGSKRLLNPSEEMHVTQYISMGDLKTGEDAVARLKSISAYPYRDGVIPVAIVGYTDESGEDAMAERAYYGQRLQGKNITYGEGIYPQAKMTKSFSDLKSSAKVLMYQSVYGGGAFDNRTVQEGKFKQMKQFAAENSITPLGFIPYAKMYNLDTIDLLARDGYSYAIGQPNSGFYDTYYPQTMRNPAFADLRGNKTNTLVLPVSEPPRDNRDLTGTKELERWKAIIDFSAANGGLSVIAWTPDNFSVEYHQELLDITDYALMKGLTFVPTDELASHFRLTQNVDTRVADAGGNMSILAYNRNNEPLEGLTYTIDLPMTADQCPYTADGAIIDRITNDSKNCRIYASLNLKANETKRFQISGTQNDAKPQTR